MRPLATRPGAAVILSATLAALQGTAAAQDPFPGFGKRFAQFSGNPLQTLESVNPWNLPRLGQDPIEPDVAIPGTIHPDVLYFPEGMDGYRFWMVFTPYEGWKWANGTDSCGGFDPSECPPVPWWSPVQYWERITLLRSHDGWNWEKTGIPNNPIVSPASNLSPCAWDTGVVYDPDIVYAPGKGPEADPAQRSNWFLYFAMENECGREHSIGLALSQDGLNWHKYGAVMPSAATPSVVYDPAGNNGAGVFHGWYLYDFVETGGTIGYATSSDGIHWTPAATPECGAVENCWHNGVLKPEPGTCDQGGITHEDVIQRGNEFWMYYQASPHANRMYHDLLIRRATSTDGIHWTRDPDPILSKYASCPSPQSELPGSWVFWKRQGPSDTPREVTEFYRPSAVVVGNAMYLYYGGLDKADISSNPSERDIGLAFSTRFKDVLPTHWAYDPIERVANAGIWSGCGAAGDLFCPERVALRTEAASFVFRGAGFSPSQQPYNRFFCDIPNDASAPEINALYEHGRIDACGDCGTDPPQKRFCPQDSLNRLQLGLFLFKALGLSPSSLDHFTDVPVEHRPKIDSLYEAGLVDPCGENLYCPDAVGTRATLSRAIAAAFLQSDGS